MPGKNNPESRIRDNFIGHSKYKTKARNQINIKKI